MILSNGDQLMIGADVVSGWFVGWTSGLESAKVYSKNWKNKLTEMNVVVKGKK